eukprot:scaffold5296_cov163-Amphora_coffeaeformis.AAC.21
MTEERKISDPILSPSRLKFSWRLHQIIRVWTRQRGNDDACHDDHDDSGDNTFRRLVAIKSIAGV